MRFLFCGGSEWILIPPEILSWSTFLTPKRHLRRWCLECGRYDRTLNLRSRPPVSAHEKPWIRVWRKSPSKLSLSSKISTKLCRNPSIQYQSKTSSHCNTCASASLKPLQTLSMPNRRSPSHHLLNSGPLKHPVHPVEDIRSSTDVFTKELEHPRHGEREIRQVGDGGSVL